MRTPGPGSHTGVPPRENPFATSRLRRLSWRPAEASPTIDLDALLARLDERGGRAAVVGPVGHGKTTLLDALERRLAERGLRTHRLAVHPDRPLPRQALGRFTAAAGPRDFLLLDGAGHLPVWRWWRLRLAARRAAGLLIAVHRPGRLPTLHRCTTSPALLRGLIADLLDGRQPPVPLPSAEALHARHGGNLRLALSELYDRCAGRRCGTMLLRMRSRRG